MPFESGNAGTSRAGRRGISTPVRRERPRTKALRTELTKLQSHRGNRKLEKGRTQQTRWRKRGDKRRTGEKSNKTKRGCPRSCETGVSAGPGAASQGKRRSVTSHVTPPRVLERRQTPERKRHRDQREETERREADAEAAAGPRRTGSGPLSPRRVSSARNGPLGLPGPASLLPACHSTSTRHVTGRRGSSG